MPASAELAGAPQGRLAPGPGAAPERHVFVVCDGESCHDAGSNRLLGLLHDQCPHRSRRGHVRVSASRCLGRCGMAPAMVEDGRVLGWVSLHRLKSELIRLGLLPSAA
jgi:NADH:ubiquinone oxidoreductase subunit E